jgi:hypothetical protein
MPNYNTQAPPYSIFPGDVALAFNSEGRRRDRRASNMLCRTMRARRITAAR